MLRLEEEVNRDHPFKSLENLDCPSRFDPSRSKREWIINLNLNLSLWIGSRSTSFVGSELDWRLGFKRECYSERKGITISQAEEKTINDLGAEICFRPPAIFHWIPPTNNCIHSKRRGSSFISSDFHNSDAPAYAIYFTASLLILRSDPLSAWGFPTVQNPNSIF